MCEETAADVPVLFLLNKSKAEAYFPNVVRVAALVVAAAMLRGKQCFANNYN